jgi:hypothetical protein
VREQPARRLFSAPVYDSTRPPAPPRHPPPEWSGAGSEEEKMDDAIRQAKPAKLVEIEGYESSNELMEAVFSDSVFPTICMNEGCVHRTNHFIPM